MTTIAFKRGILAGDTKITGCGNSHWGNIAKIKRVDNWLIGACGAVDAMHWFLKMFDPKYIEQRNTVMGNPHSGVLKDDDLEALIISPNGKVFHVEEKLLFTPLKKQEYFAIGSGEQVALGAMCAGATAIEAVKAALRHDGSTGGRVQFLKLRRA